MRKLLAIGALAVAAAAMGEPDFVQRGAAITLKVPSFATSQQAVADLAQKHRGAVADRSTRSSEKGSKSGWMRVQVPKDELDALLADCRGLGKVYGERLSQTDLSSQYTDYGQRSQRLQEHQQRLSNILTSRKLRGSDMLFVQERILRTAMDQDSLLDQRLRIPKQAATSSVTVTLFEPAEQDNLPRGFLGSIRESAKRSATSIVTGMLSLGESLAGLLIYAILGWIAWLIFRRPIKALYAKAKLSLQPAPRPEAPTSGAGPTDPS